MRYVLLVAFALLAPLVFCQGDGMAEREAKVRKQLAKDRPYKAISLCTGALGIEERAVFHVLRADAHNRIGQFAEAGRDARQGLNATSGDREALLQLAIAEQGLGDLDSAVIHYRTLLSTEDNAGVRYRLATALQDHKDYPGALLELNGALSSIPAGDVARTKVLRSKGECLALAGDTAGASATFAEALATTPDDPIVLNSRAWFLYAAHGQHDRAIADYDHAIKHNPNYSYAFNNRGWSRFKNGDTKGALKDIGLAKKKKPLNPFIYRNLGIIALASGDREEACSRFHRALELNFTAVHGDEVERLSRENCGGSRPVQPPPAPTNAPDKPKPANPPNRTNAPE